MECISLRCLVSFMLEYEKVWSDYLLRVTMNQAEIGGEHDNYGAIRGVYGEENRK